MTAPAPGAPRFVAFSTIDDEPWEAGARAGELLGRVRDLASFGIGHVRFTEILDCGAEAGDVLGRGIPLAEARGRFPAVFRGDGAGPGLPALDLTAEIDALAPPAGPEP